MNSKDKVRNGIIRAQGSNNSAVLFVAGDNKMKDHANRTNIFGRARMLFMALLMVLTMTATAMSGTDAYAANDTVYVATYDQLRVALEDTPGVKEVVVDPQAAVEEGEVVYGVEDDENSDAFYIGFDGPLTVSHDITITTADDVDVFFARSDSFRRDQGKPALFNIDRTGSLELDGLITMTGEEVTTAYNDREFVFSLKSRDGTGEDNDAWNRGQVLQGGYYIQNNGGEYNLGDDVVLEDFHTTDDVEGVEPIFEKETNSLFGAKKSGETAEEAATEEETAEETTEETTEETVEKEEEPVVAPAPKRMMMKSASPQLRGAAIDTVYVGGYWVDHESELPSNARAVETWEEAVDTLGTNPGTIYIGKTLYVSGEVSTKNHEQQVVKRSANFDIRQRPGDGSYVLKHNGRFYISYHNSSLPGGVWEDITNDWNYDTNNTNSWQYHWDNNFTVLDATALKGTQGLPDSVSIFKGIMFGVDGSATFKDIHVDGQNIAAEETCIHVEANETLNILTNAKFENLRNMGTAYDTGEEQTGFGGVIRVGHRSQGNPADGANVFIDGGIFENNEAKYEGGVISASGTVTITVRSGQFRKNKAHAASVIANYDEDAGNLIELYNAVIRNNKTDEAGKTSTYTVIGPYSDEQNNYNPNYILKNVQGDKPYGRKMTAYYGKTDGSAGGINICIAGNAQAELYGVDGAAIYGNTGDKGDIGVWTYQQNLNPDYAKYYPDYYTNVSHITTTNINDHFSYTDGANMLGGGSHRWSEGVITYRGQNISGVTYNPNGYRSNPSESDKASAMKAHTTIIEDNLSHYHGAIQTNRKLVFGRSKAAFELKKIDGVTGDSIGGVEFKLYSGNNTSGTPVKTATTNALGLLIMNGLDAGEYILVETKKEGYQAPGITWKVTVTGTNVSIKPSNSNQNLNEDDAGYYVIENTPITQVPIELKKVGEGSDANGLAGVTFKLYEANVSGENNDHTVKFDTEQTVTSATGGIITLPTTKNGTYLLFESSVPAQYKRQADPWEVVINNGQATVKALTGSLKKNGAAGTATGYHWDRSANGERLTTLPEGDYTAEYFANKVWAGFYFGTALAENTISNEKISINLTKVRSENGNYGAAITNNTAQFALYEADKSVADVTSDGNSFNNVNIGIKTGGYSNTNLVTDNNGVLNISGVSGEKLYLLFETDAPDGYAKRAPWLLYVKADGNYRLFENSETNTAATSWNTSKFSVEVDGNNKGKLKNAPIKVEYEKFSKEDSTIKLTTAEFDLYHAASTENPESSGYKYKIDPSNNSKINANPIKIENGKYTLPITESGMYLLFETKAPEGYVKPVAPWGIYVDAYGKVTGYKLKDNLFEQYQRDYANTAIAALELDCHDFERLSEYKIENTRKPIELYKVDEKKDVDGNIANNATKLAGAKFIITKATKDNDNDWYLTDAANGKSIRQVAITINGSQIIGPTGTDGKLTIENLDPGDYLLFEETAPIGFVWAKSPWLLQVKESPTTGYTWQVFRVIDKFRDQVKKNSNKEIGYVNAINLDDLQSTQRYWHNEWFDRSISVDKLDNEPKYLEKVDSTDKTKPLPDVEFKLYGTKENSYHNNKYLMEDSNAWGSGSDTEWDLKSGSDGRVELPSIVTRTPGKYILVETKAAPGYKSENSINPWVIEVARDGTFTVKAIKDTAKKYTGYGWYTGDISTDTSNGIKILNKPGQFYLTKVDGYTNKPLSGAVFHIYGLTKNPNYEWTVNWNDDHGLTTATGSNGRIQLPDTVGTSISYIMFEDTAPTGYKKETTPWILQKNTYGSQTYVEVWKATPVEGKTDTYTFTYGDACHENYLKNYPSVNLTKVDLKTVYVNRTTGEEVITPKSDLLKLSGVKFKLYNATVKNGNWTPSGNPIIVEGSDSEGIITTDKDGVLQLGTLEGSENGKNYLLEEYEPKNSAYVKPTAKWRITVYKNGSTYSYKIYVPTDDTGTTYIENSATDGIHYITNSQVYDLPSAGGMGTYWFMIIGAMMMGFALTAGFTKVNLLKLLRR